MQLGKCEEMVREEAPAPSPTACCRAEQGLLLGERVGNLTCDYRHVIQWAPQHTYLSSSPQHGGA